MVSLAEETHPDKKKPVKNEGKKIFISLLIFGL